MKIGYACIPLTVPYKTTRTVTLKNYNKDKIESAITGNLNDLYSILKYNVSKDIKLFRISSDIIPLGSHSINDYNWQYNFKELLSEIGSYIINNDIRVSMHPGQYTILNSPKIDVVNKSINDLIYHCNFLDSLGLPSSHKLILHVGGIYGNKYDAMKRFIETYNSLPKNIKNRLIIENDERFFSIYDLFKIHESTNVPLIFDNLHYECYGDTSMPLRNVLENVQSTWKKEDGDMKIHYSQQNPLKKIGAHGYTTILSKFNNFLTEFDFSNIDIMLEVKDKNISTMKVINSLKFNSNNLPINIIENEINNYTLPLMEHLGKYCLDNILEIQNSLNINNLYSLFDSAIYKDISIDNFIFTLNYYFHTIESSLNSREKNHYNNLYKNSEFYKCKEYLKKLADKSSLPQDTYYFYY